MAKGLAFSSKINVTSISLPSSPPSQGPPALERQKERNGLLSGVWLLWEHHSLEKRDERDVSNHSGLVTINLCVWKKCLGITVFRRILCIFKIYNLLRASLLSLIILLFPCRMASSLSFANENHQIQIKVIHRWWEIAGQVFWRALSVWAIIVAQSGGYAWGQSFNTSLSLDHCYWQWVGLKDLVTLPKCLLFETVSWSGGWIRRMKTGKGNYHSLGSIYGLLVLCGTPWWRSYMVNKTCVLPDLMKLLPTVETVNNQE